MMRSDPLILKCVISTNLLSNKLLPLIKQKIPSILYAQSIFLCTFAFFIYRVASVLFYLDFEWCYPHLCDLTSLIYGCS